MAKLHYPYHTRWVCDTIRS